MIPLGPSSTVGEENWQFRLIVFNDKASFLNRWVPAWILLEIIINGITNIIEIKAFLFFM